MEAGIVRGIDLVPSVDVANDEEIVQALRHQLVLMCRGVCAANMDI